MSYPFSIRYKNVKTPVNLRCVPVCIARQLLCSLFYIPHYHHPNTVFQASCPSERRILAPSRIQDYFTAESAITPEPSAEGV